MPACTATTDANIAGFSTWKAGLTGTTGSVTVLKGLTVAPTEAQKTSLSEKEADVRGTLECLSEKINAVRAQSSTIAVTQASIQSLKDQIQDEKETIAVARDRVKYIRHPEEHTSYYESWFPLNRPLKQGSLTLLLGLSLVSTLVMLFILLSFLGFTPTVQIDQHGYSLLSSLYSQFTWGFWLVLLGLVAVIWYFVYRSSSSK